MQATEKVVRREYKTALTSYLKALSDFTFGGPMDFHFFLRDNERRGQIIPERVDFYPSDISFLERAHNGRASFGDYNNSHGISTGDRLISARNTWGLTNNDIARYMEVSEEDVFQWCEGGKFPPCVSQLADVLQVPVVWIEDGDFHNLPANSPVGFLVGDQGTAWRRKLYYMTKELLGQTPFWFDLDSKRRYILELVMSRKEVSRAARHCGGYWQLNENRTFSFTRWEPVYKAPFGRGESPTEACPLRVPPVYAAWLAIEPVFPLILDGSLSSSIVEPDSGLA